MNLWIIIGAVGVTSVLLVAVALVSEVREKKRDAGE